MPTPKFQKGCKPSPNAGRKKGTPNKFTTLKQAFINAFNSPQLRGELGLVDWAKVKKNQPEFYKMLTKLFPTEVKVSGDLGLSALSDEELAKKIKDLSDD